MDLASHLLQDVREQDTSPILFHPLALYLFKSELIRATLNTVLRQLAIGECLDFDLAFFGHVQLDLMDLVY